MDWPYLIAHWTRLRAGPIETVDRFRDDELDFRPWPAPQIMLQIAQEEHGEFG